MVTQQQFIDYFTNLATKHRLIGHVAGTKDAFFYIPMAYDLAEIDKAIRNTKSAPFMTLDALQGSFDSNDSENNVQTIDGQIMVLDKATTGDMATIRAAQDHCLKIGLDLIARLKHDSRKRALFDPLASFSIKNVKYDPIGPMAQNHYGYTLRFQIHCPFGYTVDSGTWLDK